jgi:hypothetical protein
MEQEFKTSTTEGSKERTVPTVAAVLADHTIVELLYRPEEHRTLFCVSDGETVRHETSVAVNGERLVPYSPNNNLLTNEVVLLPSEPEEFGSEEALVSEIQAFIHRYVDVSPLFARIAGYYVLLTWVYEAFSELPYLRLRGDPGSGKTRFLLTVGSLCCRPIFASGASTVSPIFRILDAVRGTLIIDEGDFRFSDERAEIVKILNNGNAKGFPVLRSEASSKKEYTPTAYHVFGPKLVATRGFFEDRALESRCLTEEMGQFGLRRDVPINLPPAYKIEALHLRNKLLLFRFRNLHRRAPRESLVDRAIEPRLNQIFVPLLSIIEDEGARRDLRDLARRYNREIVADRGMDTEAQVLEIIRDMLASSGSSLVIKDIASWFADRHGADYERKISPHWIGRVIRKRLQLKTERGGDGAYEISPTERPKLSRLYEKYGIVASPDAAGPGNEPPDPGDPSASRLNF